MSYQVTVLESFLQTLSLQVHIWIFGAVVTIPSDNVLSKYSDCPLRKSLSLDVYATICIQLSECQIHTPTVLPAECLSFLSLCPKLEEVLVWG